MYAQSKLGRVYGWQRAIPNKFAKVYRVEKAAPEVTTMLFDKYNMPPIYNQLDLGSCTANGAARLLQYYLMNKDTTPNPSAALYYPSRLFIYWWERFLQNTVNSDSGATISMAVHVLQVYGACSENMMPYITRKFVQGPSDAEKAQALKFRASSAATIDNTNRAALITALAEGYPIEFGFTVYESFESQQVAATGIVPMPRPGEPILGGHATDIVGFNNDEPANPYYLVANSWGKDWGINGYFKMPAAYIEDPELASDFHIVKYATPLVPKAGALITDIAEISSYIEQAGIRLLVA